MCEKLLLPKNPEHMNPFPVPGGYAGPIKDPDCKTKFGSIDEFRLHLDRIHTQDHIQAAGDHVTSRMRRSPSNGKTRAFTLTTVHPDTGERMVVEHYGYDLEFRGPPRT